MKLGKNSIDDLIKQIEDATPEDKATVIMSAVQTAIDDSYSDIVNEYQNQAEQVASDISLASKFGLRQLNTDEKQFIDTTIKQGIKGDDKVLIPSTTVSYVFEDIKNEHPLFAHFNFAPAGIQEWIISENSGKAIWGTITSKITEELAAEVKKFDLGAYKLSAFMFVPRGIIDLGHQWIDKFVREILKESIEDGMEEGYITGDGKEAPIGLDRDLSGNVVDGVYPKRTAVKITDFGPNSFAKNVLPTLNRAGKRNVHEVVIVANQNDLDTTIFNATHILSAQGYVEAKLPKKLIFVASKFVEAGKAIAFLPGKYKAGISKMAAESSDTFKFLDHVRTYIIVAYGNGRLVKNGDAVLLDISELKPLVPTVITEASTPTI